MKEKATLYDYVRMCDSYQTVGKCDSCPIGKLSRKEDFLCDDFMRKYPRHANRAVLEWCKKHPAKTRQDKFLEMFPNAELDKGVIDICPRKMGTCLCEGGKICSDCRKSYWLVEVEK